MMEISGMISSRLLRDKAVHMISSRSTPAIVELGVLLDWDLVAFVKEQKYDVPVEEVLDRVICLTGTWGAAYATTPLEYLKETWPLSYAPVYGLIKSFLTLKAGNSERECKLISTSYDC